MKSKPGGKHSVEILYASPHGIWLGVEGRELFLSTEDHPWFLDATLRELEKVQLLHGHHLHWPTLDVDLHLDSLIRPEAYPLKSRVERGRPVD